MLLATSAIIIGLIILVWSSDQFVNSAASVAKMLGMSTLMIGLTVVSFGTSAPEMMVAINAALEDAPGLAVGNAIGSNIANIGLVLGITALVCALPVQSGLIKREIPILLIITAISGVLIYDLELNMVDGLILLALMPITLLILHKFSSKGHEDSDVAESEFQEEVDEIPEMSGPKAWGMLAFSLALLVGSSKLLVWGASSIAVEFGISELVIGLTIVAVGTSLPELAASLASAIKGHHDLAIGNVIGSNMFNLMTVLSMPGIITLTPVDAVGFNRDYLTMLALTVALCFFLFLQRNAGKLNRFHGLLFLIGYIGYMVKLYIDSAPV